MLMGFYPEQFSFPKPTSIRPPPGRSNCPV
jgi:hypothetical protein